MLLWIERDGLGIVVRQRRQGEWRKEEGSREEEEAEAEGVYIDKKPAYMLGTLAIDVHLLPD